MRLFKKPNLFVANVDNDADALALSNDGWEELSQEQITSIFGSQAHESGPQTTRVAEDGTVTFTPPEVTTTFSEQRQNDILAQWPVAAQLEALTEAMETPPRLEKLEQLKTDIQAVKTRYPKAALQTNDVQNTSGEPAAAVAAQTTVTQEQSHPQPAKRKSIPLRRRSVVRSRRSQLR